MAKQKHRTVLFLCTGNYYRSRFAEVLFNSVAERMGLPWRALSRGLALERGANNVGPMAASAIKALEALGVCTGEECARAPAQVTTDDLVAADRVIALKQDEHLPLLRERFPAWAEKVEFWHVDDAPGVLGLIEREVMGLVARLLGGGQRQESQPTEAAQERPAAKEPARKPLTLKVGTETAGRRGKGVTTVFDLPLDKTAARWLQPSVFARHRQRHGRQPGSPLAGHWISPVAGLGGGDAEENLAGLNRQEGKADAALDDEFFPNRQHMLLHGCASVRIGRVRTLREKGRERPSPPAQEGGRKGRRAVLRTPGARGSAGRDAPHEHPE